MAGIANLFALIDRLKRNTAKNLQDPIGALELGLLRADEDFKANPVDSVLNSANLGGLVGMTKLIKPPKAPQADALETARRNAVEMLGLPENNTAMDRARAMGFDTQNQLYHGTKAQDIESLIPSQGGEYGSGVYLGSPELAGYFAAASRREGNENILPLLSSANNPLIAQTRDQARSKSVKALQKKGFDSVKGMQNPREVQTVIFNPNQIRSRFAAFDPARRNEANLLASRLLPLALPGLLFAGDEEE